MRRFLLPHRSLSRLVLVLAPLIAAAPAGAASNSPCTFSQPGPRFPHIPVWAYQGAYQDSSQIRPNRCIGSFGGPLLKRVGNVLVPDSLRPEPRTITVRFLRDRHAEARSDFGGYRVYRVYNSPDTSRMVLIRRFSRQLGDQRTWSFSIVDPSVDSLPFKCAGRVANDSVVTFIDPDSSGNYVKVCRKRIPQEDPLGACDPTSRGDSVFVLLKPPGPHDGFRVWYTVTYEARNITADPTYDEIFVPDTTGIIGPCGDRSDLRTCPNLNNRCYNLTEFPVEATGGPTANLERVGVVPNPYRAHEAWDRPGASELHFINLPDRATIKIFTPAGDLVAQLEHENALDGAQHDFERWDLKNQNGREVASGIYIYRIDGRNRAGRSFSFRDRFIIIR